MKRSNKIRVSFKETIIIIFSSILLIVAINYCDKVNSPRIDTEPVANINVVTDIMIVNSTTTITAKETDTTTSTTTTTTMTTATTTTTIFKPETSLTSVAKTTTVPIIPVTTNLTTTTINSTSVPITTITTDNKFSSLNYITEAEYIMLCNCVGHEYGSDWIDVAEKAKVVEVVMNRVYSKQFPNTIYEVLTQPYQFSGAWSYINLGTYSSQVTDSVKAAVDYYFANPNLYNHGYIRFEGDGYMNYFYTHF